MENVRSEGAGFPSLLVPFSLASLSLPSVLLPVIDVVFDTFHIALMKSHGFSCSCSSHCREMGRIICSATMWVILRALLVASESSKSIMVVLLVSRWSDDGNAVHDGEAAGVTQEQLDQVVADVAVAAEHLERVVGDLEHLVGGVLAGEIGLGGSREAAMEGPGRYQGERATGNDIAHTVLASEGD